MIIPLITKVQLKINISNVIFDEELNNVEHLKLVIISS